MEFNLNRLGVRIREERIKRKLTIEELAEIVNITPSFLGLVERGSRGLSIEKLCKISKIFNVSIDSLLSLENGEENNKERKFDKIEVLLHKMDDNQIDFVANMIKLMQQHFDGDTNK